MDFDNSFFYVLPKTQCMQIYFHKWPLYVRFIVFKVKVEFYINLFSEDVAAPCDLAVPSIYLEHSLCSSKSR